MEYRALDIARYIINHGFDCGYRISNLKLQKILYFVQANFLVNTSDNRACFKEIIEAWTFGPVVPVVYHEYKQFGSSYIPYIKQYMDFDDNIFEIKLKTYDDSIISDDDKMLIDEMIEECAPISTTQLVEITHNQDPWKNAYRKNYNNEITKKAIFKYFNKDE